VTSALTVAIVACLAVEVAISRDAFIGEGATLSVVYRMGGIHQPAILAGEWQRLIAAPFLHFGLLHLAMNGWAQWSLGAPIEFLVGPWRFLILWVGSALGASLTSLFFNESSVSAGASGAIFGLLGAFTTFIFFRKDVLPQPVPRALRNGVLATLLLNLMISFIPSIDMAAHAGGFVTGAIMALGLVKRDRTTPPLPARAGRLRLAVAVLVVLGVGVTSLQERADLSLRAPRPDTDYQFGELKLPIPRGFVVSETRTKGLTNIEADPGPASPFSVTFKVSDPQADEAAALRVLHRLRPQPAPVPDSGWIAVSQLGLQNLRAIEIVVTAPASGRAEAEKLSADLARRVR
jgi:rhomboid protease GluP